MKFRRDQQSAHSASASRTGSRQAGHKGGRPTSSTGRRLARSMAAARMNRRGRSGAIAVVDSIVSGYCRADGQFNRSRDAMAAPRVFDRPLLRARRRRAAALGASTFLLDRVADDLADRLGSVRRSFPLTVDLGTPTAAVQRVLAHHSEVGTVIAVDAVETLLRQRAGARVVADEE